jgi:hypothetical protein
MATVQELRSGDVVTLADQSAVFIASEPHPEYPGLRLVIWKLDDGTWSLDALSNLQEVGDVLSYAIADDRHMRWQRIQEVFDGKR